MDNLRLIEIQVDAPKEEPEVTKLIAALRKLYSKEGLLWGGVHVSCREERVFINYARTIQSSFGPREIRDSEYRSLVEAVAATCIRARGTVTVCALTPAGPTYEVEFYSKDS